MGGARRHREPEGGVVICQGAPANYEHMPPVACRSSRGAVGRRMACPRPRPGGQRENMEAMVVFVHGRCRSGASNHLTSPFFEEPSIGTISPRLVFVWLSGLV
ncbi:hypothetical protein BDA96_01G538900 [Sorghum bicolor]|uniref:Uncharacterized protein n=2 Tax=Sorghum bicolor TaxID=4558 RepID=A0A921S660_SORBI|nr:hypothetical protein BDA96_01G538900 [Sorghum bicolor]OQU93241.1 hypothetical protein SORBI_3001G505066 [Sorghum bicolor]